jgi:hypothetical protein
MADRRQGLSLTQRLSNAAAEFERLAAECASEEERLGALNDAAQCRFLIVDLETSRPSLATSSCL